MAWLAVENDGSECICDMKPIRSPFGTWIISSAYGFYIPLPKGSIKKLIGREITWNDEPIELE